MKVMIVDDHTEMRRVLMTICLVAKIEPMEIIECETGEDAIHLYSNHSPDCVLMDFQLKTDMNGIEASEQIITQDSDAKIIIVSSDDSNMLREKAGTLSLLGFISKANLSEIIPILQTIDKQSDRS